MSRTRLAVLFGGNSSEHDVSLRSARAVLDAVDPERFDAHAVGISRDGKWRVGDADDDLRAIVREGELLTDLRALQPDVVFPVLHGPNGEDGTVQGLLELNGLPYVGSGVLASATCMDKIAQKQLLAQAAPSVRQVPWTQICAEQLDRPHAPLLDFIESSLRAPYFCKPANMGSSVGVRRCGTRTQLRDALVHAAQYDRRIIVEQGLNAREIELAVLGDGGPSTLVSAPGEIVLPPGAWYDYETKYQSNVARCCIPADLSAAVTSELRDAARLAFFAMGCFGLARIDFFFDREHGHVWLNEINTMPGCTSISMYPKLMAHSGIPLRAVVTRLCELAMQRAAR